MTTFRGTVLVLTSTHQAPQIAERIARTYYINQEYHYKVTASTPDGLPTDLHDQVSKKLSDSPEGSSILTIYPFAGMSQD